MCSHARAMRAIAIVGYDRRMRATLFGLVLASLVACGDKKGGGNGDGGDTTPDATRGDCNPDEPACPGGDRRPVIVCSCLAAAHSLQAMSVRISMRPSSPRSIVCNPSWLDDFAIDIDRSDSTESSSRRTENEVEIRHPDIDLEMNDAACT